MNDSDVPGRIQAAAFLLAVVGVALFAYTVMTTLGLVSDPDPMLGLELLVGLTLLVAAAGAMLVAVGLIRSAAWARGMAITAGVLLVLAGVSLPFAAPRPLTASLVIDPISVVAAVLGVVLVVLSAGPRNSHRG